MRRMTFALLFVLLTGAAAAQQLAPAPPPGNFLRKGPFTFRAFPQLQGKQPLRVLPRRLPGPNANLCYKLRVYQMARRPHSDETYPVGERTCTPASRFQLKPPLLTPGENPECGATPR